MGIIEQPGGVVALAAGADPAIERVLGWRRFWLGVDLAQAQDFTALVVVKDECLPLWHGSRQILGERMRTIVFADRFNAISYPDVVSHLIATMQREPLAGRVELVIDATGLGRVVSDLLTEARINHLALQSVVGQNWRRDGRYVNVGKHLLLETLSVLFSSKGLRFAAGLELKPDIEAELETFRLETTRAGQSVITQGRAGHHHGDLAVALAIAAFASQYLVPPQIGTIKLRNYY